MFYYYFIFPIFQSEVDGSTIRIIDGVQQPMPGKLLTNGDAGDLDDEEGTEGDQSELFYLKRWPCFICDKL